MTQKQKTKPADNNTLPDIVNPQPPKDVTITTTARGLQLASIEDMWKFANYVIASKLAPKGIDKPESVVVILQMGFELGLPPMQSLQNIAVINGRPAVWGDAVPGLVEASGKQEYGYPTKVGECGKDGKCPDDYGYKYTTKRKGRDEYSYTFTVADARTAKLWGKTSKDGVASTWVLHPSRMLLNRARTFCLRDVYADVLKGLITIDEAEHISVDAEYTVEDDRSSTEKLADIVSPQDESIVPASPADTPDPPTADTGTGEVQEKPEEKATDDKDGPGSFDKDSLNKDLFGGDGLSPALKTPKEKL